MITGSVASSLQGEPRATHDIDLVVEISAGQVDGLLNAFPAPDFYVNPEAVREAIRTRGMFNVISVDHGDKVDFWLLTDDPFDQSRFARKYVEEVFGIPLQVSRPEDTILQKLKWAMLSGGSPKLFTDALRVFEVQRGVLDLEYLDEWASRLDVFELWTRLKAEADPI
jgi:hypothetical protein